MLNDYQYIDPDYTYTDPKTGILRNLADITNPDDLLFFESSAVVERTRELKKHPVKIKDSSALLTIHKHLFQDVYKWAGEVRTVNISKSGKPFIETNFFSSGFSYVDSLIAEYRNINTGENKLKPKNWQRFWTLLIFFIPLGKATEEPRGNSCGSSPWKKD
jgi:cell filamentation protein